MKISLITILIEDIYIRINFLSKNQQTSPKTVIIMYKIIVKMEICFIINYIFYTIIIFLFMKKRIIYFVLILKFIIINKSIIYLLMYVCLLCNISFRPRRNSKYCLCNISNDYLIIMKSNLYTILILI